MVGLLKSLFGKKGASMSAVPDTAGLMAVAVDTRPIHVTDDTFDQVVLRASLPTLVDFWAPWCGPCRMVSPIIEELAKVYSGQVVIAKINTDENARTATELGIMGIPTLILFKGGEEVDRVVGYAPRHALEEMLQAALG